jgi:lipopolysaccharide transport system ATP-binding protein
LRQLPKRDSSPPLIEVDRVSKIFCRDLKTSLRHGFKKTIKDLIRFTKPSGISRAIENRLEPLEFWANKDISFELRRGEALGLIGPNGAGKTTLLKLVSGLIRPDEGKITTRGNLNALIALGAGFNPLLTGRENIVVNGAILGLSTRQIKEKLEKIIDFAELRQAIDAPVRSYSSGMQVRLGFATAVNLIKPDILLLDEILAVGDIGFAVKCLNVMRELSNECAVIFVSHSMQYVSAFCTHCLLLENGKQVLFTDDVGLAITRYHESFDYGTSTCGTGQAEIKEAFLYPQNSPPCSHISIPSGTRTKLKLLFQTETKCYLTLYIMSQSLFPLICSIVKDTDGEKKLFDPGEHQIELDLGSLDFNAGKYPLTITANDASNHKFLIRDEGRATITITNEEVNWGFLRRDLVAETVSS